MIGSVLVFSESANKRFLHFRQGNIFHQLKPCGFYLTRKFFLGSTDVGLHTLGHPGRVGVVFHNHKVTRPT